MSSRGPSTARRALGGILAAGGAIVLAPLAALVRRSWRARVAVEGHSMEPTLRAGDWLLVDPDAYRRGAPQLGELVVAADPRRPARLIVKRLSVVDADGQLSVAGDHPAHADERLLVTANDLLGRPWFRYWPIRRLGRVR